MKKILIFTSLFLLVGCTWNYQEKTIIVTPSENKTEEELLLEKQKAEEVIKLIKENEDIVMSKVLDSFLKSEEIDIQQELLNTQNRYNDLLGPILEYEHEKIETQTGTTLSGSTLSGSIISNEDSLELDELLSSNTGSVYSGEVKINGEHDYIYQFELIKKVGKSGTYTGHILKNKGCKGGLEMLNNQGIKIWLFENTCNKMMYDFELAIGGIKVYYKDENDDKKEEFVSIN